MPLAHMGSPQGRPASLLLVPSSPRPHPPGTPHEPPTPGWGQLSPSSDVLGHSCFPTGAEPQLVFALLATPSPWDRVWDRGLGSAPWVFSAVPTHPPAWAFSKLIPVPGCRALSGAGPQGDCGSRNAGRVARAFASLALPFITTHLSSALFLLDFALSVPTHTRMAPAQSRLSWDSLQQDAHWRVGPGAALAQVQSESTGEMGAIAVGPRRKQGLGNGHSNRGEKENTCQPWYPLWPLLLTL